MSSINSNFLPASAGLALGNPDQRWTAYLQAINFVSLTSSSLNPAQSGVIELALGDAIGWRNSGNNGDDILSVTQVAVGTTPADVLTFSGSGIAGPFISNTSEPSSTGEVRLAHSDTISWRNAGDTADLALLKVNSSDQLQLGPISVTSMNGGRVFAEQFAGADASAKIMAAINSLPINGGVVDATNLQDLGGSGSATIDPGSKCITLLLGPYIYNFSQVVLQNNFTIIGMGDGLQNLTYPGTQINQVSAATDLFVLGTITACYGTVLRNFRVNGASTTSGNLFNLIATGGFFGSGLIYADWSNLTLAGFGGYGMKFDGTTYPNQQSQFRNIKIFRPNTASSVCLNLTGSVGQMSFYDCQFETFTNNGLGTNVQLFTAGNNVPYSIMFWNCTNQDAAIGFDINVARAISIIACHFEAVSGCIHVAGSAVNGINNSVHIRECEFENNCGINAGNGYIVNASGTTSQVWFQDNTAVNAAVDTIFNVTTPAVVVSANNVVQAATVGVNSGGTLFRCSEVASVDSLGLTAAVTATTLYTPQITGMYRVSSYLKITTTGTSPVIGPVTIAYTDGGDSVAQSVVMAAQTQAGVVQALGANGNTTTSTLAGSTVIYAKQGVAITYAIALTGTVGAAAYEAHLRLEAI